MPALAIALVVALPLLARANGQPSQLVQNLSAGKSQTVVTYGTSLTRSEWPDQLTAWLQSHFPGQVQLINRGRAFMASQNDNPESNALNLLDSLVLSQNPDTVFLEFAINDALVGYNITPQQSRDNLNTMIDRILDGHADREIIVMTMNPAWDPPNDLSGSSARPNLADHYQGYRDVAAQRGVLLVDNYLNWIQLRDTNPDLFKQYIPDGVHPTGDALAQMVTPEIIRVLTVPEPASAVLLLAEVAIAAAALRRARSRRNARSNQSIHNARGPCLPVR